MRLLHQYVLATAVSAPTSVALYFIPKPIKAAVEAYLTTTLLSRPDTILEQIAKNVSTDNSFVDVTLDTVDHASPVLITGPNPSTNISAFFAASNGEIWAISALRDGYVFLQPYLHTLAMRIHALDANRDVLLLCLSLLILLGLGLVVLLLVGLYFLTAMQNNALHKTLRERLVISETSLNAQTHNQENCETMITRRESSATLGRAMNRMARQNLIALDRKDAENEINLKEAMKSKAGEYTAALESAKRDDAAAFERAINGMVQEHAAALENKVREIAAILEGVIYGKARDRTAAVESNAGETSAASSRAMSNDIAHALALEKKDVANSAAMKMAMANKDLEHATAVKSKDHEHALALETKDREHAVALESKDREHALALQNKDREHALALQNKDREHALALQTKDQDKSAAVAMETVRKDRELALALEDKDRDNSAALTAAMDHDKSAAVTMETIRKDRELALALENKDRDDSAALTKAMATRDREHAHALENKEEEHLAAVKQAMDEKVQEHNVALDIYNRDHSAAFVSKMLRIGSDYMIALSYTEQAHQEDLDDHARILHQKLAQKDQIHQVELGRKDKETRAEASKVDLEMQKRLSKIQDSANKHQTNTTKLASDDETARTKLQAQIVDNLKLRAEIRKLNEESDSTRQSRATILGLEASAKTVQQQLDDANNEVCQLRRELIQAQDHHDTEEAKENILGLENAHKAECQKLCSLIAVLREVIKKNKERNGASDGAQQKLGQEASHTFPSEQKKAISADNTDDAVASQNSQPPAETCLSPAIANEEKAANANRTEVTRAAANQLLQSPAEKAHSPANESEEKMAHTEHADPTGDSQAHIRQTTQRPAEKIVPPSNVNDPKGPLSAPGPNRRSRRAPKEGHEPYQFLRHYPQDRSSKTNINSGCAGPEGNSNSASAGPEEGSLDAGKAGMHESKWAHSVQSTPYASKKPMQESKLEPEQPTPDIPQTPMQGSNLKPEQPTPDMPQTSIPAEPPTINAEDRSKDSSIGPEFEEINPKFNQKSMGESRWAPSQQPTSGKGKKTNDYPKNARTTPSTSAPTKNPTLDPKSAIAAQPTPGAGNSTKGHPKEAGRKQPTSALPRNPMLDSRWATPEASTSGAREDLKWPRPEKRSSDDPNSTTRDSKLARHE